ncbi:GNAT family N-acetyltransferase [candidate division KSB1 bacterium]|nr:GNAT family N-acetyltransferase [candidate division KSB1 bacterium]
MPDRRDSNKTMVAVHEASTRICEANDRPTTRTARAVFIRKLDLTDTKGCKRWDDFVNTHPYSNWAFSTGFGKILADIFGYIYHLFELSDANNSLIAICPLYVVPNPLTGKQFVSIPFFEYGGILARPDIQISELHQLRDAIASTATAHNIKSIQLKANPGIPEAWAADLFTVSTHHHHAVLELSDSATMWQTISRHVRKAIKQANNNHITIQEKSDPETIKATFYPMYTCYMKQRHGSPPFSLQFFIALHTFFGDNFKIFWAYDNKIPIGCLIGLRSGKRIHITNIVSDQRYWHLRPNDLLHWEFIKWACDKQLTHFDFGAARPGGQAQFKKKWGCQLLPYNISSIPGFDAASADLRIDSQLAKWCSFAWKHAIPKIAADRIGPTVRKYLGK